MTVCNVYVYVRIVSFHVRMYVYYIEDKRVHVYVGINTLNQMYV